MSTSLIDHINYYDQLGLSTKDTTARIRHNLDKIERGWMSKAGRSGLHGIEIRQNLDLVSQAKQVFQDDGTRAAYDNLLRASGGASMRADVDWLRLGWNYYYMEEYGPAAVSVRRAKELRPQDPKVLILSAWVQLAEENYKEGKREIDEAFVLDERGNEVVDIMHCRGWAFYLLGQPERAAESLDRALQMAEGAEIVAISAHLAFANEAAKDYRAAINAAHRCFDAQTINNPWMSQMCALLERCILGEHQDFDDLGSSMTGIVAERRWVAAHRIDHPAAKILIEALTKHMERLDQLADARSKLVRAKDQDLTAQRLKEERAGLRRPRFPWISLGLTAALVALGFLYLPFFFGAAAMLLVFIAMLNRRNNPKGAELYSGTVTKIDTTGVAEQIAKCKQFKFASYPE